MAGRKRRLERATRVTIVLDHGARRSLDDLADGWFGGNRSQALRATIVEGLSRVALDIRKRLVVSFKGYEQTRPIMRARNSHGAPRGTRKRLTEMKVDPEFARRLGPVAEHFFDGSLTQATGAFVRMVKDMDTLAAGKEPSLL